MADLGTALRKYEGLVEPFIEKNYFRFLTDYIVLAVIQNQLRLEDFDDVRTAVEFRLGFIKAQIEESRKESLLDGAPAEADGEGNDA